MEHIQKNQVYLLKYTERKKMHFESPDAHMAEESTIIVAITNTRNEQQLAANSIGAHQRENHQSSVHEHIKVIHV